MFLDITAWEKASVIINGVIALGTLLACIISLYLALRKPKPNIDIKFKIIEKDSPVDFILLMSYRNYAQIAKINKILINDILLSNGFHIEPYQSCENQERFTFHLRGEKEKNNITIYNINGEVLGNKRKNKIVYICNGYKYKKTIKFPLKDWIIIKKVIKEINKDSN